MTKTVVGLFDNYTEAQQVVQELRDRGFKSDDISLVARDTSRSDNTRAVGADGHADDGAGAGAVGGTVLGGALGLLVGAGLLAIPGIGPVLAAGPLAAGIGTTAAAVGAGALGAGIGAAAGGIIGGLVGAGVPEEQAQYYAEGVRRGGALVTVRSDDDMIATATSIMDSHGVVNMQQRGREWRDSGWTGFRPDGEPYTDASTTTTTSRDSRNDRAAARIGQPQTSGAVGETVLPVIEEEIDIQKRRVEQGGVRVNTRVEERPVDQSINLRDERVHVERRPVDRPVTDADATAFEERSFELTESTEEPVVRKRARVVEEVIVNKEVQERSETIHDTVRRTDVNVEQLSGTGRTAGVSGTTTGGRGLDAFDQDFRSHYEKTSSSTGLSYDDYKPVYQYGYDLASDKQMSGRNWSDIESDARTRWDEHNPGTWEQFKDTVHYAWQKARGKR